MKELTPERKKMLAYLIRRGLAAERVSEVRYIFFMDAGCDQFGQPIYNACVWGLAFIGLFHNAEAAFNFKTAATKPMNGSWDTMRKELDIPEKYFDRISRLHEESNLSAFALANALENNLI